MVWVALVTWFSVVFAIARSQFLNFDFGRFDLGNMVQAVWSTAHGRPLEITMGITGDQLPRLAGHVDPILILFAPLWIVLPTPLTLVAVQIARVRAGGTPGAVVGTTASRVRSAGRDRRLTYLAYPWLAWTALDAMHPVVLVIPLLLFALWFLDNQQLGRFAVVAVLICATGELMGLTVAALGIWYAVARGRRNAGLVIALGGVAWSMLCVYLIVPNAAGEPSMFYAMYEPVGGSPQGVLEKLVTDPGEILSAMTSRSDLVYVFMLLVPVACLPLLAPALLAVLLPQLAVNGLSSLVASTDARTHHASVMIPILIGATIFGASRLPGRFQRFALVATLSLSLGSSVALGAWPGVTWTPPNTWLYGEPTPEHRQAIRAALALVPSEASVASTNRAGSQLSARRYIYSVPNIDRAGWVVIDTQDPWVPFPRSDERRRWWGRNDPELVAGLIDRLRRSPGWRAVFDERGVGCFAEPELGRPQTATAPRRKSTISPVVAPGPKTSATPFAFSSSASSGGIVPPTTTRTSSAPFARSPSTIRGTNVM